MSAISCPKKEKHFYCTDLDRQFSTILTFNFQCVTNHNQIIHLFLIYRVHVICMMRHLKDLKYLLYHSECVWLAYCDLLCNFIGMMCFNVARERRGKNMNKLHRYINCMFQHVGKKVLAYTPANYAMLYSKVQMSQLIIQIVQLFRA